MESIVEGLMALIVCGMAIRIALVMSLEKDINSLKGNYSNVTRAIDELKKDVDKLKKEVHEVKISRISILVTFGNIIVGTRQPRTNMPSETPSCAIGG